jgi:hypothetical protein
MQERVALLGGRFDAHPRSSGGFAIFASIPTQGYVPGGSLRRHDS